MDSLFDLMFGIMNNDYDKERAEAGHSKWCEFVKTNPEHVYSVQVDEHVNF